MIHGLFSVQDKCALAWLPPFTLPSDAMAIREFSYAAGLVDHKFCIHAKDYSLYKVGLFDDQTGLIQPFPEPLYLVSALVAKQRAEVVPDAVPSTEV